MQLVHLLTALLSASLVSATPIDQSQDLAARPCSGGKKWGDNRNSAIELV